ncbi:iron donor protein CyaY [Conservatibacter flavescens]|uniref:Iron-sulfur cluster assembly protein CyaY n=1 Tax=Conservatibacter flavescens TaxID=28161 RepID=A0A2M8S2M7_9PAST|nr:iron donor protein CyaY [Conservatibacter flavescens]PJG85374.1 iron donor protein CyaY [Conservatibacter flavescens]
MNLAEFHKNIEQVWAYVEEQLEEQDCDVDCDTQGAVFSITFNDRSQIIINKQEPMLEMWLASRLGGLHFAYKNGEWINSNQESFWQCLTDACAAHGETVDFKR